MDTFWLALAAMIALILLFASIGPFLGLVLSVSILWFSYRQFRNATGTGLSIFWGIIGILAMISAISHFPGILALFAAYVLYLIYKQWNKRGSDIIKMDEL